MGHGLVGSRTFHVLESTFVAFTPVLLKVKLWTFCVFPINLNPKGSQPLHVHDLKDEGSQGVLTSRKSKALD